MFPPSVWHIVDYELRESPSLARLISFLSLTISQYTSCTEKIMEELLLDTDHSFKECVYNEYEMKFYLNF